MYRKVRLRLTLLFTLVTSILLAALLCVSFFLSARQQLSLQQSSFTSQSFTVVEAIREQNILTSQWLSDREEAAGFRIYLWDNDVELFHNHDHQNYIRQVYSYYLPALSNGRTLHALSSPEDISVGCHGLLPEVLFYHKQMVKNSSILQIYFLQSLDPLYEHLRISLLLYLVLLVGSECLLTLFCWYFTGKLLQPLLDTQESQNRFISVVSHELRTPLAVILSSASACEKAPRTEQKSFFQVIEREGTQMSAMLEQLLTLSRADSHGLRLQIEKADLQTLLLETYESFQPLAAQTSHRLSIRLPESEIPLCDCDVFRIRQVCHILLHNAISYTPAGSGILLYIADGTYEKEIAIGVQDNGPGIPEEERDKIFDRFYRGAGNSRSNQNNTDSNTQTWAAEKGHHGLGLAVAREIAAAHRGTLTVSEAPGGGALFLFTLPVVFDGSYPDTKPENFYYNDNSSR